MKTIVVLLACIIQAGSVQGQAKQRKELLLQIAALRVYADYAQKGYSTVKKGLDFIGDVKKGEVNLHGEYFTSLQQANPRIKNYVRVAGIISLQFQILKNCKATIKKIQGNDLFHGHEIEYIKRSLERLLDNCSGTIEELLTLTRDASMTLTDDQRLERIDKLYQVMLDDYRFCKSFSTESGLLSVSRGREQNDAVVVKGLYGFKN